MSESVHFIYDASVRSRDPDYHAYWCACGASFGHDTQAAADHLRVPALEGLKARVAELTLTGEMVQRGADAIKRAEDELSGRPIRQYPDSWRRTLALAVLEAAADNNYSVK